MKEAKMWVGYDQLTLKYERKDPGPGSQAVDREGDIHWKRRPNHSRYVTMEYICTEKAEIKIIPISHITYEWKYIVIYIHICACLRVRTTYILQTLVEEMKGVQSYFLRCCWIFRGCLDMKTKEKEGWERH